MKSVCCNRIWNDSFNFAIRLSEFTKQLESKSIKSRYCYETEQELQLKQIEFDITKQDILTLNLNPWSTSTQAFFWKKYVPNKQHLFSCSRLPSSPPRSEKQKQKKSAALADHRSALSDMGSRSSCVINSTDCINNQSCVLKRARIGHLRDDWWRWRWCGKWKGESPSLSINGDRPLLFFSPAFDYFRRFISPSSLPSNSASTFASSSSASPLPSLFFSRGFQ